MATKQKAGFLMVDIFNMFQLFSFASACKELGRDSAI